MDRKLVFILEIVLLEIRNRENSPSRIAVWLAASVTFISVEYCRRLCRRTRHSDSCWRTGRSAASSIEARSHGYRSLDSSRYYGGRPPCRLLSRPRWAEAAEKDVDGGWIAAAWRAAPVDGRHAVGGARCSSMGSRLGPCRGRDPGTGCSAAGVTFATGLLRLGSFRGPTRPTGRTYAGSSPTGNILGLAHQPSTLNTLGHRLRRAIHNLVTRMSSAAGSLERPPSTRA